MEKTIEQKLINRILAIINRHYFFPRSSTKHIIVREHRLKVVHIEKLCTCDIYVLKLTNTHGNQSSRLSASLAVRRLNHQIPLPPLLKP